MSKTNTSTDINAKLADDIDDVSLRMERMEAVAARLAGGDFDPDTRKIFNLFAHEYEQAAKLLESASKAIRGMRRTKGQPPDQPTAAH